MHLLEWLTLKRMTIPSADKVVSNWNPHKLLMEISLAVSHEAKYILAVWPSNITPEYLTKRNENRRSCKDLYMNIHNSFIHNCSKLEMIQISINQWMNIQIVVHSVRPPLATTYLFSVSIDLPHPQYIGFFIWLLSLNDFEIHPCCWMYK